MFLAPNTALGMAVDAMVAPVAEAVAVLGLWALLGFVKAKLITQSASLGIL
jgi:hypothetical protein